MGHSATSGDLSNSELYTKFVRTCAANGIAASVVGDMASYFNWKRIAVIHVADSFGHNFNQV